MTHQTKTEMHPADIEALKTRHEYLVEEMKQTLVKAICHKVNCQDLSTASADVLLGYSKALASLSDHRRAVEKQEREMRKAGL